VWGGCGCVVDAPFSRYNQNENEKNSPNFFFTPFFVLLNSLAVVDAQGLHPLVGLYMGHLSGWWRHFSRLDVIKSFIAPFLGWVILGAIIDAHGPCAFLGCYTGRPSTGEGAGWSH
jgi:hypothetical protein